MLNSIGRDTQHTNATSLKRWGGVD